jgi:hypothetical protein
VVTLAGQVVDMVTRVERVAYWTQVHRQVRSCIYSYSCGTGSILNTVHKHSGIQAGQEL